MIKIISLNLRLTREMHPCSGLGLGSLLIKEEICLIKRLP